MTSRSPNNRSDLDRRQFLSRLTFALGGAVSMSLTSAVSAGMFTATNLDPGKLHIFTKDQLTLFGDMAQTLIPRTETPGARDVNAHFLADELVANWMTKEESVRFISAFQQLMDSIHKKYGKTFSALSQKDKTTVLDHLGKEMKKNKGYHVYSDIREMTIFGYYTSEIGASEELIFDPVPGPYQGCVDLSTVGKTYAL
ncbi:gluconate 2-dehydrogenase subunit 3 family protein [Temperatibacter marinus]|uniref:Gluconate 2-dehydrogenase subunit 3 family protein n=1 Tax=Temperatibacter marinus TaxID=1456591 RepID=A0AA52EI49_9PROT|nr:gluconate 2-dehydrogenase subunit 3 family protein [Temperatibacter marinus]WND02944.1 gluconate 2-dehydrogenase subunit 3 family protein [Temperatibacter marinus]